MELHDIFNAQAAITTITNAVITNCQQISDQQRKAITVIDKRAVPHELFYGEDFLMIHHRHRRNLDYYGGFEYVDPECVTTLGEYVVYSYSVFEDARIKQVVDFLNDREEDEED